jgi:acetyl-CoA carboxylase biotin carboxyl carrier protein
MEEKNMLTEEEILQILRLIDESNFDELFLEIGDLKLSLRKGRDTINSETLNSQELIEPKVQQELNITENKAKKESETTEEGFWEIKAPMLGIFYDCPEPGAPPFVEVGSFVEEDTTVCLLEVMKVFNTVKAGMRGFIYKICAERGQLAEYGQTLFLVTPTEKKN